MKQAADLANRFRVLQSTWLRHCREALTPQAVPSSQALVFSSHVGESHFTWATGNLFTKTSVRSGSGAGRARCTPPEALRKLLLERRPEKAPIGLLVPAQLPLHRPAVRLLLGKEVLHWDRTLAGVRLPGEGLVVGDDTRNIRTRTHEVEDLEGHAESEA